MSVRVGEFLIRGDVEPWQRLGLTVVDAVAHVGTVRLRFEPGDGGLRGLVGWGLVDAATGATDIDGLATTHVDGWDGAAPVNELDIVGFDHVVVNTSSLDRTCGAIEAATGAPLKRVREAGPGVRQGFHRLGEVIVEVVESARVTSPTAAFWGFVWNVADLHEVCERLGPDVVGLPKAAVQPGRFIATVRGSVGLGLPLALMTP
ncbi:MAG: hypothetical protein RJA49_2721 [Actinomycetota bacterium]